MARRVFFSFHYGRDVRHIQQVRQSWVVRRGVEAQPFFDKAEFEKVKARQGGMTQWTERQLSGTSVTMVLFGAETSTRSWVQHEIRRSHELNKGIIAIAIHSTRDPQFGQDIHSANPLDYWTIDRDGSSFPLSCVYRTYDWVRDSGYANMPTWIENAARATGR